ncbi:hypothetical protein ATE84_4842 [Aquimarina sp. MAR_2010_214]|nr:hypothetical protein ATE84_4842 [Aquimarina sp. MAR_2010_214]
MFAISVLPSCNKDDDQIIDDKVDILLMTGMYLRADINDEPLLYGNPNINNDGVMISPNPMREVFNITSFTADKISKVWIVEANPQKKHQDVNFSEALKNVTYDESELTRLARLTSGGLDSKNVTINIEDLQPGYFRVFIKTGKSLRWDNIYISNGNDISIEDIVSFWK